MILQNLVLNIACSSAAGQHDGDLGGPPIPEFARKALSEAQPGQPGGPSKRKRAAAKAQAEDQQTEESVQKAAAQAKAVHDAVSNTRYRGSEPNSRHRAAADGAPQADPAAGNRPAHGDSAAASAPEKAEHSHRKRDGGEQESQAHKRPKQKGRAAGEGGQQQQRQLPERKPAAAKAGAEGQAPAVKAEEQEADRGRGCARDGGAEGSAGYLAAVEYLGDGATRGQQLGEVNLASFDCYMCAFLLSLCANVCWLSPTNDSCVGIGTSVSIHKVWTAQLGFGAHVMLVGFCDVQSCRG